MANPGWIFKFVTDQNILVFHKATLPLYRYNYLAAKIHSEVVQARISFVSYSMNT